MRHFHRIYLLKLDFHRFSVISLKPVMDEMVSVNGSTNQRYQFEGLT